MPTPLLLLPRHQQVLLLLQALRDLWRLRHENPTPDADWLAPPVPPRPGRLHRPRPEPEPQGLRLENICY